MSRPNGPNTGSTNHPTSRSKRRSSLASKAALPTTPAAAFERVRAFLGGRLLLASDFDGTLATPALDPWQTSIIPLAQRSLRRLAVTVDVHVALISGRTVADLAARTAIPGASFHGDHGAEWADASARFDDMALSVQREPATAEVVATATLLKAGVPRLVIEPWLVLEDKGPALTFHFRAAPDVDAARARVTAAVDAVDPDHVLQRFPARRSLELRAGDASTKATTLARLIRQQQPATVLMLGDDHHDSGAFAVLRRTRAAGHVAGLAIGVVGPAVQAHEVAAHADLLLAGPDDVAVFLALLSDVMSGIRAAAGPQR